MALGWGIGSRPSRSVRPWWRGRGCSACQGEQPTETLPALGETRGLFLCLTNERTHRGGEVRCLWLGLAGTRRALLGAPAPSPPRTAAASCGRCGRPSVRPSKELVGGRLVARPQLRQRPPGPRSDRASGRGSGCWPGRPALRAEVEVSARLWRTSHTTCPFGQRKLLCARPLLERVSVWHKRPPEGAWCVARDGQSPAELKSSRVSASVRNRRAATYKCALLRCPSKGHARVFDGVR